MSTYKNMRSRNSIIKQGALILLFVSIASSILASSFNDQGNSPISPQIRVYPQPANENVNLEIKNLQLAKVTFSLYDLIGKVILSTEIDYTNQTIVLKTSDLQEGIYFYQIVADNKVVATSRLIIKH
jgi:hypothetical protein